MILYICIWKVKQLFWQFPVRNYNREGNWTFPNEVVKSLLSSPSQGKDTRSLSRHWIQPTTKRSVNTLKELQGAMAAMGDAVIQQLLSGCFTSHSFMLVEKTHMTSGLMFARRQFRNTGKEIGRKCCGMIRQTPLALPIAPAGPILLLYQWSLYIVQYTGNGCMILCMWYCFSILAVLKYLVK